MAVEVNRMRPNYDVCLSFAGEDRAYVEQTAAKLKAAGVRVFYDEFEKISLWGKDLYTHLHDIYQNQANYCVIFISENYAKKAWTKHERKSAQARAFSSDTEYILPVRFDETDIPGIPDTVGYLDLREISSSSLADIIVQKIEPRPRENYIPPIPDRLFKSLGVRSKQDKAFVNSVAHRFFYALTRLSLEERRLIYDIFIHCCPAELPDNVHIDLDLLRRITDMPVAKIKRIAGAMQSLGFYHSIRESHNPADPSDNSGPVLVLEWQNTTVDGGGNHTLFANEILQCATDNFCPEHAREMFERLDFGQLASATQTADTH